MNNKYNKKNDYIFTIIFAVITIVVVAFAYFDRVEIINVFKTAKWEILIVAILVALTAYVVMSLSLQLMNSLFRISIGHKYQFMVNFITLAIGNLMDFGGAVGFSLRAALYKARGGDITDSVSASIYQSFFATFLLIAMFPISIAGVASQGLINADNTKVFSILVAVSIVILLGLSIFIFLKQFRLLLSKIFAFIVKIFINKDIYPGLKDFSDSIDAGLLNTREKPRRFFTSILAIVVYWNLSVLVLWLCFYALGVNLNFFVLTTGFIAGTFITNVMFIPGGIGVQEFSMAGILALLGIDFHLSVLVTFVFRSVYYLFTTFISLLVYWLSLRRLVISVSEK